MFIDRLRSAWASWPDANGASMDVPVEYVLAHYAAHSISKMNANFGFGMHIPGLGRQPVSERETNIYFDQLGKALVGAIQRDFSEEDRRFGTLACLAAEHILHVGRIHLSGLVVYQTALGNALANANREGEEARREERLRIWGYA